MKTNYLAIIVLLILCSCNKDEVIKKEEIAFNNPNWIKLEIPNKTEANAVFGSIEDTLLVATVNKIYQITEKGKKLTEANSVFNQRVFGFVKSNDTLYALMANHLKGNNGLKLASHAQQFSLDMGLTWHSLNLYTNPIDIKKNYQEVKIADNLSFNLNENIEPFPNSPIGSGIVLKSDVIINKGGLSTVFNVPFNNQITSLHLDKYGKLYISAASSLHDPITKKFSGVEKQSSAVVYISKKQVIDLANN